MPYVNCTPPVRLDNFYYNYVFEVIATAGLLFQLYVIYCIIFLSTSQMKGYMWYLLGHQVIACFSDFWVGFVLKPVILVPLPVGYLTGVGQYLISAKIGLASGEVFVNFSYCATIHLFVYRYTAIRGRKRMPWWSYLLMGTNYSLSAMSFVPTATYVTDNERTFRELQQEFSCITSEIMNIPRVFAYSIDEVLWRTIAPILGLSLLWIPQLVTLSSISFKAINIVAMSAHLRKMQRRFLVQLLIQTNIPVVLDSVPVCFIAFLVMTDNFTFEHMSEIAVTGLTSFGLAGGIVLVVMNPPYHSWLWKVLPAIKPKTIERPTISVNPGSSTVVPVTA